MVIAEDLEVMEHFPNNFYNFHRKSPQGVTVGIQYIIDMLNAVQNLTNNAVLLETMAEKGTR